MKLEMFINFNGNCREAVEFYVKVFKSEAGNLMTYGATPPAHCLPTPVRWPPAPKEAGRAPGIRNA